VKYVYSRNPFRSMTSSCSSLQVARPSVCAACACGRTTFQMSAQTSAAGLPRASGVGPVVVCCTRRDAEDGGRLLDDQAGEIAQLHQPRHHRLGARELREGLIQGQQVLGFFRGGDRGRV
jgi:hypothetical protein